MVTLEAARQHNHLEDASDEEILRCLQAARAKARAAGVPEYKDNALYDLFLLNLCGYFYEQRGMEPSDPAGARRMIDAFVLELRYGGG